jgi:hypothetical protein
MEMAKKTAEPRITGIVRLGKKEFRRGQEAELGKVITPAQAQAVARTGAITGDWSGLVKADTPAPAAAPEAEEKTTPRRGRG